MAYSRCCDKMCVFLSVVPVSIVVVVVGAGWLSEISGGMAGVGGDIGASSVRVLVSDKLSSELLGSLMSIIPSVKSVDR